MGPPALIHQSYRFALAPTPTQEERLLNFAGAARFAFNWGLALVKERLDQRAGGGEVYVPWSYKALCSEWKCHKATAAPWRDEVIVGSFQAGFEALGAALQHFSQGRKSGRRVGFPRFRVKGRCRDSFFFQYPRLVDARHLQVPKLGAVRTKESMRKLDQLMGDDEHARLLRATVSRTPGGWFLSLLVERSPKRRRARKPHSVVGMDVGLRHRAILSTGEKLPNERCLQGALGRLRRLQRQLDRQRRANNPGNYHPDGTVKAGLKEWHCSARMKRTEERVRRVHARAMNLRREAAHQLTSALTREYGVIGVESLNVAGMLRDRALARQIADVGWGMILNQLNYKTSWAGSTLVCASRFYPSSKTCSACGVAKAKLGRGETIFTCKACGLVVDRDENAAINLALVALRLTRAEGRRTYLARAGRERQNARRGQVRRVACDARSPLKREDLDLSRPSRARKSTALASGHHAAMREGGRLKNRW
jgi:putative transposase